MMCLYRANRITNFMVLCLLSCDCTFCHTMPRRVVCCELLLVCCMLLLFGRIILLTIGQKLFVYLTYYV
jgi:hypothetical protein